MGVCGWGCVQTPRVQASKVHVLRGCWALLGCSTKPMVRQLCLTPLPGMGCAARSSTVAMTPAGQHQACPMACSDEPCRLSGAISRSRWAVTCPSGGAWCRLRPAVYPRCVPGSCFFAGGNRSEENLSNQPPCCPNSGETTSGCLELLAPLAGAARTHLDQT